MVLPLTPAHGWVAAVVAGSWIVHHVVLSGPVMSARKKFSINYPVLYATEADCKNEEHRNRYNCVQRGHQNALENQASFLSLLLVAGATYPITAAIAGASYLLGRVIYMEGYKSGKPDSRLNGAPFQYGGLLTLLGCTIRIAVELLRNKA